MFGRTEVFPRPPALQQHQQFERHEWHGAHIADRDRHHWNQGHWFRGDRGGRHGWWWVIGPSWYFYSAPVYPYPDPDDTLVVWEAEMAGTCRDFQGDAIINDTGEPFYGTACLQPDGQWHIVTG